MRCDLCPLSSYKNRLGVAGETAAHHDNEEVIERG
jgi:hypothetical protein